MKNSKNLFFSLIFVFSLSAKADLEIKGLQVDKPINCEQVKSLEIRKGNFFNACENKSPEFFTKISFLETTADMFVYQSELGMLKSLLLINFSFDKALSALQAKYGEGDVLKSTIQNRMGATFEQVIATWTDGATQLRLTKHASKLNEPSLWLIGELWKKETKEKTKPSSNI